MLYHFNCSILLKIWDNLILILNKYKYIIENIILIYILLLILFFVVELNTVKIYIYLKK